MLPILILSTLLASSQTPYDPDPEGTAHKWVVVYNADWPDADGNGINDSEEVARHWAKRRGAPASSLLGINFSFGTSDIYSGQAGWEEFWDEMVLPLRSKVVDDQNNHALGFLFVYGVPMRIAPSGITTRGLDTALINLWDIGTRTVPGFGPVGHSDVYFDAAPTHLTDPGRFDPVVHRFGGRRTYLVARLDGLTKEHAMEMVDSALYGDVYLSNQPGHYTGLAYCDTRYGAYTAADLINYPYNHFIYANADKDMAYGRAWLEQAGFTLMWEPYGTEIGEANAIFENGTSALTAPNAMIYEGWYNYNTYHDVWYWMVGSMACDLNSNSVARLRTENPGTFLSSALHRGLTCGPGVVAEPYLNGHPYPEVFTYYMVNGYPFSEAARISDSKSRWTNLYLGDPLYQPFRAGKVPQVDVDAPPPCEVLGAQPTINPGEWQIDTFLNTLGQMPDLGTLSVEYGEDLNLTNNAIGADARPRVFQQATLSGLSADEVIYYRPDYTDVAGNVGQGEVSVLFTGLASRDVVASIESDQLSMPAGTPFTIELAIGANAGLASLTSYGVELTATHMGLNQVDFLPRFQGPNAEHFQSPDDNLRVVRLPFSGNLAVGTYLLEVNANSPAGTDFDSVTVVVF